MPRSRAAMPGSSWRVDYPHRQVALVLLEARMPPVEAPPQLELDLPGLPSAAQRERGLEQRMLGLRLEELNLVHAAEDEAPAHVGVAQLEDTRGGDRLEPGGPEADGRLDAESRQIRLDCTRGARVIRHRRWEV